MLVFQSMRELLFNVLKHAGTGHAELSVEIDARGELVMAVVDHGEGFEVSELAGRNEERKRFGLFSIRERMEAMGREICAGIPSHARDAGDADSALIGRGESKGGGCESGTAQARSGGDFKINERTFRIHHSKFSITAAHCGARAARR